MNDPRLYPIALTMINGVGHILGRNLLQYFGNAEAIFKEKQQILEKVPGIGEYTAREIKKADVLRKAEKEVDFIEKKDVSLYIITDEIYPYRLKECADAPIVLYGKGNINLNSRKILSIVGTRRATGYGNDLTEKVIQEIATAFPDMLIVSGLAYGIDIQAHRCALKYKLPTVGVLAHGLDRIYPHAHRETAIRMLENGGLLTDFPSDTNPDKQNFVMRNRIVAGLADATLVIESADKGGSLITADLAFCYGREVFAFPGRVNDKNSMGCNKLIRVNKAGLITCTQDLLDAMNWEKEEKKQKGSTQTVLAFDEEPGELSEIEQLLRKEPLHINQITLQLEKPVHEVSSLLFDLEMDGKIKALPGQMYKLNG
ncbi:MAG: DNA-processing protein DprA [Tannerellaceae bacterium]|nr:DNA-processing protein DprA [Tannerellaceae bacterium]